MVAIVPDLWVELRSGCCMSLVSHADMPQDSLGLKSNTGRDVGLPKPIIQAH